MGEDVFLLLDIWGGKQGEWGVGVDECLSFIPRRMSDIFLARLLGHLNSTDELVLVFGLFTANLLSDHLEA